MAYLGREPVNGYYQKQSITTDGSTTTFTLDYTVGTVNSILVQVDGVLQEPTSSYTIASGGTQIVFSEAPLATDNTFIIYLGTGYDTSIIGDASFTHPELSERAASNDKFVLYDTSAGTVKTIQASNVVASTVQRDYTGDGSTAAFTVTDGVTEDNILVIVNGIVLTPTDDYTVSGTTLTFTSAPAASAGIVIRYLG